MKIYAKAEWLEDRAKCIKINGKEPTREDLLNAIDHLLKIQTEFTLEVILFEMLLGEDTKITYLKNGDRSYRLEVKE